MDNNFVGASVNENISDPVSDLEEINDFNTIPAVKKSKLQMPLNTVEKSKEKLEAAVLKIFDRLIEQKTEETFKIQKELEQCQITLNQIRLKCVVKYYSSKFAQESQQKSNETSDQKVQKILHPTVKRYLSKRPKNTYYDLNYEPLNTFESLNQENKPVTLSNGDNNVQQISTLNSNNQSRFSKYNSKKKIIVGNLSRYLKEEDSSSDNATHKWMVYVRTPLGEEKLETFVSSVVFFLHSSYSPHDKLIVSNPPFNLSRRGWGEFELKVQLNFKDARNQSVLLYHTLKLDKTLSGLQTTGHETISTIELEIFDIPKIKNENLLNASLDEYGNNTTYQNIFISEQSSKPLQDLEKISTIKSLTKNSIINVSKEKIDIRKNELNSLQIGSNYPQIKSIVLLPPSFEIIDSKKITSIGHVIGSSHPRSLLKPSTLSLNITQNKNFTTDKSSINTILKFSFSNYNCFETMLKSVAKQFYLFETHNKEIDFQLHPYRASDMKTFLSWPIAKRRAHEMSRAIAIKNAIKDNIGNNHKIFGIPIWTVHRIVKYLKYNGFTYLDNEFLTFRKRILKKCILPNNFHKDNIVTTWSNMLQTIDGTEVTPMTYSTNICKTVAESVKYDPKDDVDILTEDVFQRKGISCNLSPNNKESQIKRMTLTKEATFVEKQLSLIGIKLQPIMQDNEIFYGLIENLIFISAKLLMDDIFRQSIALFLTNKESKNEIDISTVLQVLKSDDKFDIFTHSGTSVILEDNQPSDL